MIQRILNFAIRKDITKKNKSINHAAFVRSMPFGTKIPYLAKYHKKKLIASILALVIIYTYDLQKPIYRYIVSIRSPMNFVYSIFAEEKKIPNTILQQNYAGVDLSQDTIKVLLLLYSEADKQLYFGVGRNLLFEIYKEIGSITGEEETKKFWLASGFYKQRNQKASGVGLVQYLHIFEQGLKHAKKKQQNLTQQQFLRQFVEKFIQKTPFILQWEKYFNKERTKEFLKNMPGDNEKKKDAIIEIMRDMSKANRNLIPQQELEQKIKQMGLKGLNLTDKVLYWELKRTWQTVRMWGLDKKISHPLIGESQKVVLNKEKQQTLKEIQKCEQKIKQIQAIYEGLYHQSIF